MERIYARKERGTSELLREDASTRDECKQLNTMLAESLDEEMDLELPDSEGDEL